MQAQMTCSHFGVTLEEAAEAHIIPWTTHYPSAMDDLQKQDPRLYAYCVQNSYKVQKSDHGLIVTGGPDKDDPLNCMGFELFRAITYAIWEDRIGDLNLPTLLRDFGEEDEAL
ncbi:hypothetical protein [Acutalibacter sp. 1XD8-33]|uniref:hypothetical protein n=1 Tax=Acutalibacter sp. 1XD8-33 TaxID=2320081 RepID=UPI0011C3DC78|nr:hypothetical protein [Acutalibacter sp. 1XD8-33]